MTDPARARGGFADLVGYELSDWREDEARIVLTVGEQHLNRSGVLHGGVATTLLDTACGYAGTHCAKEGHVRRAFTLALNSHFVGQARACMKLTATAKKTGGGRSIFFCTAELRDEAGALIAQGDGVFKYRKGSEDPDGEPA